MSQQILETLEKINSQLNSTQPPTGRNQHGAAQQSSASRFNDLLAEAGGVGGDGSEKNDEPPAKKTEAVLGAVRGYRDGGMVRSCSWTSSVQCV